jgi:hypothetical protein
MTSQTHNQDQSLSIGAATQAAIVHRNDAPQPTPEKEHIWHQPRRIIGPDQIKALRDYSLSQTGNRFSFDMCVVQTEQGGSPSPDIDVNDMRLPKNRDAFTYGQLISYAINEASNLRQRIDDMSPDIRLYYLNGLLEQAHKDGRMMWIISAVCIRNLIFPQSYRDKRCDDVFYKSKPYDGACGKQISLGSLRPNDVKWFLSYAQRVAPTIDPLTITPITSL